MSVEAKLILKSQLLLEKGKIHAAVMAVIHKSWIVGEIIILAVLQDKDTVFGKDFL